MPSAPPAQLIEAFEQIKAGQVELARRGLTTYLRIHPQDADAWWLMANATSDPMLVRRCLEKTLALRPDYAPARARLDRLRSLPAPAFDPVHDFEPPPNLHALEPGTTLAAFDDEDDAPLASWAAALAAEPSWPSPVSQVAGERSTGRTQRRRTLMLLAYGAASVALTLVLAFLVVEGLDYYREHVVGPPDPPGTLRGDLFAVRHPPGWSGRCEGDDTAQICSFASERTFSLLDPYARGRQDLGNEALMTTINRTLFGGDSPPQRAVTGIVMDYSREDSGYEYVRQSIIWQEGEYGSKQGRTSYIRGYDLWMEYDKANPAIDGATGYVYWLTGKDVTGLVLDRHGYFIICDVYVPHDDRLLMLTVVAYSAESIDDLPRAEIEGMIRSIDFR